MYLVQTVTSRPRAWSSYTNVNIKDESRVKSMNSVEELPAIKRLPTVNTFKTAATTYDFPEHPPKKEKKWSFGNLFRRKKKDDTDSSSEEESPKKQAVNSKKKRKQENRRKKLGTFDHIVVSNGYSRYEDVGVLSDPSGGNYAGRPLPKIPSEEKERQGSFESVRRGCRARAAARRGRDGSSSDEDSQRSFSSSSLNNRRDGSLSRRSRIARTERYIKRLSKDEESILNREALQRQTKENWDLNVKTNENLSGLFTIPPSHNYNKYHQQGFKTSYSSNQQEVGCLQESSPKTNCFNVRSLSCDSNIHKSPSPEVMHVQFPIGRARRVIEPPPPPPRDPRRVAAVPSYKLNSNWHAGYRTASEDHIPTEPRQPLAPRPASVTNENRQPRYIKRHVQESAERFQYLTEKKPRSRKPIFIQSTDKINTDSFTKSNTNRNSKSNDVNPNVIRSSNEDSSLKEGNPRIIWKTGCSNPNEVNRNSGYSRNNTVYKTSPQKYISSNGIPSSPSPYKESQLGSNSSLYSNSPSFNHLSSSSLNRRSNREDHTYSNTNINRAASFGNPNNSFNRAEFWKRKETENTPSSKSPSSSPQIFTAQTHVQTKIFLPSVIQEPESADTVDFIKRNSSPFKPISSPSLADRKNEISSSADSLANEFKSEDVRRKSANLEEALDELEAIYKSLHLGDEDLLERAEQREMSIAAKKMLDSNIDMYPGSRGALSDSSFSYEPYHSLDNPRKKKLKKAQTLDRKSDDMAYRKLHKERAHTIGNPQASLASVSYLLTSPVHCPPDDESIADPNDEPDVTLDDVVYRSIKHANNSLKVADPQPPFGIPIGPITPAPNSDYLHAVPEATMEYTFKHKKIPDVVKDDLAFRNLRKDSNKEHKLPHEDSAYDAFRSSSTQGFKNNKNNSHKTGESEEAIVNKKKRAVRSLSANISNLMNQECSEFSQSSLTDIADAMEIARQILKEKENRINSTKRAFLSDSEAKYRKPYVQSASSTETITESRLNFLNEMRSKDQNLLNEDYLQGKPPRGSSPARKQSKESTPVPLNIGEQTEKASFEDMLTALAVEARETSDRITKELMDDDLDLKRKKVPKNEDAFEDVQNSILDFNKEMRMLDENLRKHELALSNKLEKNKFLDSNNEKIENECSEGEILSNAKIMERENNKTSKFRNLHKPGFDESLQHLTTFDKGVGNSTTFDEAFGNSTGFDTAVGNSRAIDEAAGNSRAIDKAAGNLRAFDESVRNTRAFDVSNKLNAHTELVFDKGRLRKSELCDVDDTNNESFDNGKRTHEIRNNAVGDKTNEILRKSPTTYNGKGSLDRPTNLIKDYRDGKTLSKFDNPSPLHQDQGIVASNHPLKENLKANEHLTQQERELQAIVDNLKYPEVLHQSTKDNLVSELSVQERELQEIVENLKYPEESKDGGQNLSHQERKLQIIVDNLNQSTKDDLKHSILQNQELKIIGNSEEYQKVLNPIKDNLKNENFEEIVDNLRYTDTLDKPKPMDDSEYELIVTTELENLDRNLNNPPDKTNLLGKRLSEIDAVSEHAKMCEKLFECVVESAELIAATKTESNPVEEVENIETRIPESVANIVTTRNVEEGFVGGGYENLGSDSESKSPFEERKAELIATFRELDKSAPLALDEVEMCDEEILKTVNDYGGEIRPGGTDGDDSSSSKYEDLDGKSSSSKYEDLDGKSSSSKCEDFDGRASTSKYEDGEGSTSKYQDGKTSSSKYEKGKVTIPKYEDGKASRCKYEEGNVSIPKYGDGKASSSKYEEGKVSISKYEDGKASTSKYAKSSSKNDDLKTRTNSSKYEDLEINSTTINIRSKYEDPQSRQEDFGSSKYEGLRSKQGDGNSSSSKSTDPAGKSPTVPEEAKGGEECVLGAALPVSGAHVCKSSLNIPATYTTNCDIYVSDSHSESGFHSNSSCTDSASCHEMADTVDPIPSLYLDTLKSPTLVKETSRRLSIRSEEKKDGKKPQSCSSGVV